MEIFYIKNYKFYYLKKNWRGEHDEMVFLRFGCETKLYFILEDVNNNIHLILFIIYSLIKVKNI